jgi:NCS1 family nucleobase:cation symporter-1
LPLSAQNWRAALALAAAVPPLLPGLIGSIDPKISIGTAPHLFDVAWFFGFFVASGIYTATSLLVPAKETFLTDEEVTDLGLEPADKVEVEGEKEKDKF